MSSVKKVLHIVSCLELGGTEAFIMNNYRHINKDDMQFDFFIYTDSNCTYVDEIKKMGGQVFIGVLPSFKNTFKFYKAFKNIIKQNGPYDAIHCHTNLGNAYPLFCGFMNKIKIRVSHSHATNYTTKSAIKRIIYGLKKISIRIFGTNFLACSAEAGRALYGKKYFEKRGEVINNGISAERYLRSKNQEKSALKKEFCLSNVNYPVLGNITRFDDNKNQQFIIDVFKCLLVQNPDAVLILGGVDGGQLDAVKTKVKELDLENNVRFIGKRQDIPDCLALIDVYFFPSLYEGLGIVLLEAQAAGCLCFASDGVSKESDMGLGTAHYYSLDLGADIWAEKINNELKLKHEIPDDEILLAFRKKGYDIVDSSKKLVRIYEG